MIVIFKWIRALYQENGANAAIHRQEFCPRSGRRNASSDRSGIVIASHRPNLSQKASTFIVENAKRLI
jgi:hypothetical protein